MSDMKKYLLAAAFCFMIGVNVSAESVVYFFTPTTSSNECTLKMNGIEIGELRGPIKKTLKPDGTLKVPFKTYSPCYKKCVIKQEGKVLFAIELKFMNCMTLDVSEYAAEIQLNLSEGSIHYVKMSPKGLNDLQFKEITEKEGLKLMKKNVALSEYVEE